MKEVEVAATEEQASQFLLAGGIYGGKDRDTAEHGGAGI